MPHVDYNVTLVEPHRTLVEPYRTLAIYCMLLKGISLLDMNFDHSIICTGIILWNNAGIYYNNNKMTNIVD